MDSLREQYERRKAAGAAKPTPSFTTKDFVTIGISVLALGTTLFFNVFLKTDDIRGSFRGSLPQFTLSGGSLLVNADGGLIVTNTGNRAATVINVYMLLTAIDNEKIPDDACRRGALFYTYFDIKPVVFKAGEAAVIPLRFVPGTKPLFSTIEGDGVQVLACLGVQVMTPSAIFMSDPVPLIARDIKESGEINTKFYTRLVDDSAPFTIHRNWSLFW